MPSSSLLEKLESFSSRAKEVFLQIQRATKISTNDELELHYLVDTVDRNLTKISAIVSCCDKGSSPANKVISGLKNYEVDSENQPQEYSSDSLTRMARVENNGSKDEGHKDNEHGVLNEIHKIDFQNTGEDIREKTDESMLLVSNNINKCLKSQFDMNYDSESDVKTIADDDDEYQKILNKVC